jgi:hypothetical protein
MELKLHAGLSLWVITSCLIGAPIALAETPSGAHFKKVLMVVLENTDYHQAISQPFQASLAARGALLSNFRAITHPSQPNYLAMVAGSTYNVNHDGNINLNVPHLGDLLEERGLQWKVYAEDYPGNCFLGKKFGKYVRKHVPFLSFTNVQQSPERCARIVNASQLDQDIQRGELPEFSMYVPNLDNDGHDTPPLFTDQWLARRFGSLFNDPGFMQDLLVVVTYDEREIFIGPNQVLTVLYGPSIKPGAESAVRYTHYSVLRTIEDEFGLGTLGHCDAKATPIQDVWN